MRSRLGSTDAVRASSGMIMEYLSHIATFLAGLATGWTVKVIFNSKKKSYSDDSSGTQSNNTVRGDMAGRDMNKNNR